MEKFSPTGNWLLDLICILGLGCLAYLTTLNLREILQASKVNVIPAQPVIEQSSMTDDFHDRVTRFSPADLIKPAQTDTYTLYLVKHIQQSLESRNFEYAIDRGKFARTFNLNKPKPMELQDFNSLDLRFEHLVDITQFAKDEHRQVLERSSYWNKSSSSVH